MSENPYESQILDSDRKSDWLDFGVNLICIVLVAAFLAFLGGLLSTTVRDFTQPRFAWIPLMMCVNPLICIWDWRKPRRRFDLIAASLMTWFVALISAIRLLSQGTVRTVKSPSFECLPSSWFWSVAVPIATGAYLAFAAFKTSKAAPSTPRDESRA